MKRKIVKLLTKVLIVGAISGLISGSMLLVTLNNFNIYEEVSSKNINQVILEDGNIKIVATEIVKYRTGSVGIKCIIYNKSRFNLSITAGDITSGTYSINDSLYESVKAHTQTIGEISINEDELNFFGNRFDNACMDITIRNEDDYSDSYTQTVNMIKL